MKWVINRKRTLVLLIIVFVLFNIVNVLMFLNQDVFPFIPNVGKAVSGTVSLFVDEGNRNLTISSPQNITYNYSVGTTTFPIDLNISDDFNATNIRFTLHDLEHDTIIYNEVSFTPNTTKNMVRWGNNLTVYAEDVLGVTYSDSVIFYVNMPDSVNTIHGVNDSIFVCEASSLSYNFNISNADEDIVAIDLSPKNPFFIFPTSSSSATIFPEIFSGTLTKANVGEHDETITSTDVDGTDTASINITVLEINNVPNVEDIGATTVNLNSDGTYAEIFEVTDTENGDEATGNFTFSLTWGSGEDLFDIGATGAMSFEFNSSHVGVYSLSVCANDTALSAPHSNISLCGQDGSVNSVCDSFSLTVTEENQAPTIDNYYPTDLSVSTSGTSAIAFNISKTDLDGTTPDGYWFVDDVFAEKDEGNSTDEFSHTFGCGVSGSHNVRAEITDGLLNDSVNWTVAVTLAECPVAVVGAGGGGGSGRLFGECYEKWGCGDWQTCQDAKTSFKLEILSPEDYSEIQRFCLDKGYDDRYCGYQTKNCIDANSCDNTINKIKKPVSIQGCYYTENPSCSDGITNCHDGACEVLVDCGGPCEVCASCSDGKQNQAEEGVDCGGACPVQCEKKLEIPFTFKFPAWGYFLWILIVLAIIIILIKVIKILRYKRRIQSNSLVRKL
jgi:hypothetical protein